MIVRSSSDMLLQGVLSAVLRVIVGRLVDLEPKGYVERRFSLSLPLWELSMFRPFVSVLFAGIQQAAGTVDLALDCL